MVHVDYEKLVRDFLDHAEDFIRAPDFAKGMALHDLAANLGTVCNARVRGAGTLVGLFHDFKRTIPTQDVARLGALLEQIRQALGVARESSLVRQREGSR